MTCVNQKCQQQYLVIFTNAATEYKVTLDSQWISTLVGAGHTQALADRVQAWSSTPCTQVRTQHMQWVIERNAKHLNTNEEKKEFAKTKMKEFYEGLNEEYPERQNNIQQD